jgi:hypothetical protein
LHQNLLAFVKQISNRRLLAIAVASRGTALTVAACWPAISLRPIVPWWSILTSWSFVAG